VVGSISINSFKLLRNSALISLGIVLIGNLFYEVTDIIMSSLAVGFIHAVAIYLLYRKPNVRHYHEKETKTKLFNIRKIDNFVKEKKTF